jgi:hypothetical protein
MLEENPERRRLIRREQKPGTGITVAQHKIFLRGDCNEI